MNLIKDDRWNIRVLNQDELWHVGWLGAVAGIRNEASRQRAPLILFELLDRSWLPCWCSGSMVQLINPKSPNGSVTSDSFEVPPTGSE